MDKNAAPERIEPVTTGPIPKMNWIDHRAAEWTAQMYNGGKLSLKDFGLSKVTNPSRNLGACYLDLLHRLFAMQPQVSKGGSCQGVPEVWPDDVLTDMDNAWRKATDVRRVGHYETLMAVASAAIRGLARHRQTSAVSADAVELADKLRIEAITDGYQGDNYVEGCWDSDKVEALCQAYGDACRLDGARKMLEAAAKAKCDIPRHCIVDQPTFEIFDAGVDAKTNAIRALSPETVCGGE